VNGEGEEKDTYSVGSLRQRRCSLLPLHSPEGGSRASFRNVVILIFNLLIFLIFYSSDDG
jgi:hypothetical protein